MFSGSARSKTGAFAVSQSLDPPLLAARDLALTVRGEPLLRNVDLDIHAARRLMILGANGAGKSLLLRCLHGLTRRTGGGVYWRGRPMDRAARRAQAMVFQRPVMLRRSVLSNLLFALGAAGVRKSERRARAQEALEQARLEHLARRPARLLSGGEQQRLALARALACRPEILFLDEPTASLDPAATLAVEQLISAAHSDGVAIVMVTHEAGQARRLGDDIVFLHRGAVAEAGRAAHCLSAPSSAPLQAWLEGRLYLEETRLSAEKR
ncbi:MAG: ATP-binding cassette domain-containing protein [Neomegalonema sp.]|nr:ATP-binding cassette domain-containing protein [Neomegalonema sp.]